MTARSWRMAKSLETLRGEINAQSPDRSKASDGGIGDAAHGNRESDHNPCGCCSVVCARDFTHDAKGGFDAGHFAKWLRTRVADGSERRVRYVIWDRKIFSGPGQNHPLGVWRDYKGSNPHSHHVHVSVRHPERYYDDAKPWGWRDEPEPG